jgi:hypothetical protein
MLDAARTICPLRKRFVNLRGNCSLWSVGQQDLQAWQDKIIGQIGCAKFEDMTRAKTQSRKGKSTTIHHAVKNLALLASWREMRLARQNP